MDSLGDLLWGLTTGHAESSRVGSSPWARSPTWERHSSAGRLSRVPRRSMTFWESEGRVLVISAMSLGDCAWVATVKRIAEQRRTLAALRRMAKREGTV